MLKKWKWNIKTENIFKLLTIECRICKTDLLLKYLQSLECLNKFLWSLGCWYYRNKKVFQFLLPVEWKMSLLIFICNQTSIKNVEQHNYFNIILLLFLQSFERRKCQTQVSNPSFASSRVLKLKFSSNCSHSGIEKARTEFLLNYLVSVECR